MDYEYKMVQITPGVLASTGVNFLGKGVEKGNEAALYLQKVVNDNAKNGWEFYRVDPLGVTVKPGCTGVGGTNQYYVITFRKPI